MIIWRAGANADNNWALKRAVHYGFHDNRMIDANLFFSSSRWCLLRAPCQTYGTPIAGY